MNLVMRDATLYDVLAVCHDLPSDERKVFETLTGVSFEPDTVAATMFLQLGMKWSWGNTQFPLAVGGLIRQHEGVYRTWFFASRVAWDEYGRALTDSVRETIRSALDTKAAHRIETLTLADRVRARQWYERIGLQYESTLHGYCPNGAAAVLYVARSQEPA